MHLDMTSCRAHIGVHTLRFIFVNDHATSEGNKYVGPYCRAKMYARRVACCPLVSGESRRVRAKRAIKIRKRRDRQRDRQTDRQTDGRQTVTLRLPPDAASVMNRKSQFIFEYFQTVIRESQYLQVYTV